MSVFKNGDGYFAECLNCGALNFIASRRHLKKDEKVTHRCACAQNAIHCVIGTYGTEK